jgi:hypothetical protein
MKLLVRLLVTYCICFVVAYGLATSTERIQFHRPPAVVWDSYLVTYWVHVPVDPDNRFAAVMAFDGDFRVQYTEIGLEREARRTLWDQAKWRLPPGEILLVAVLVGRRADGTVGELARDVWTVRVLARVS